MNFSTLIKKFFCFNSMKGVFVLKVVCDNHKLTTFKENKKKNFK